MPTPDQTARPGDPIGYEITATRLHRDGLGALRPGDVLASVVSTRPTLAEAVDELRYAIHPAPDDDATATAPWTVTIGGVDITAALDQARAELTSARQEITYLRGGRDKALDEAREAGAALEQARADRDLAIAEARTAGVQADQIRAQRDQARAELGTAVRERDSLARRCALRYEEGVRLTAERDRALEQLAAANRVAESLRQDLSDAGDTIDEVRDTVDRLDREGMATSHAEDLRRALDGPPPPASVPPHAQEIIDTLIGDYITTACGTARAATGKSTPTEQAAQATIDRLQHLDLAGWDYRLTPQIVEALRRAGRLAGDTTPTAVPGADGCGTCWACRAGQLDDPTARVVRAALDWAATRSDRTSTGGAFHQACVELAEATTTLFAAPACVDLTVGAADDETAEPTSPADTGETS